jgi:hypothetical protein
VTQREVAVQYFNTYELKFWLIGKDPLFRTRQLARNLSYITLDTPVLPPEFFIENDILALADHCKALFICNACTVIVV